MCIEAILHTDNVHHVGMLKQLQLWNEVNSELLDRARQVFHERNQELSEPQSHEDQMTRKPASSADNVWPTQELTNSMWEPDTRRMLRIVVLHFADIASPMKPFPLCKAWAVRILEEFFIQGDLEKQNGLPVQPLNDRTKTSVPFSQVGFIEFVAAPFLFATIRLLTPVEDRLEVLVDNAASWVDEWAAVASCSEEEIYHVRARLGRLEERAAQTPTAENYRQRQGASHGANYESFALQGGDPIASWLQPAGSRETPATERRRSRFFSD